ncbi:MAG: hypothetical protein E7G62_06545 [Klebsiella grimontii]|nr:hypothetical protein [Klebsiella grimontii]
MGRPARSLSTVGRKPSDTPSARIPGARSVCTVMNGNLCRRQSTGSSTPQTGVATAPRGIFCPSRPSTVSDDRVARFNRSLSFARSTTSTSRSSSLIDVTVVPDQTVLSVCARLCDDTPAARAAVWFTCRTRVLSGSPAV